MKKLIKILIVLLFIILFTIIVFFVRKNKMEYDIINGGNILKISLNMLNSEGAFNQQYYITKNKKRVLIRTEEISDVTQKTISTLKMYRADIDIVEEYINELITYQNEYVKKLAEYEAKLNEYNENLDISPAEYLALYEDYFSYLRYNVEYNGQQIVIPVTNGFFEKTEEFIKKSIIM